MSRILCVGRTVTLPAWAVADQHPIVDLDDPDGQIAAGLTLPYAPDWYAERTVDGVRELVAWCGRWSVVVKMEA